MELILPHPNFSKKEAVISTYYYEEPSVALFDKHIKEIIKRLVRIDWKDIPRCILDSEMSTKFRNEKSFNGVSIDILKSGIQKYIRRGIYQKAFWCAVELDLFAYTEGGERTRSNMIHRLMIIFYEECALCPDILPTLDKNITFLLERNRTIQSTNFTKVRHKEMKALVECISLLCSCKKGRILSHYSSVFYNMHEKVNIINKFFPSLANIYKEINIDVPESEFSLKLDENVKKDVDSLVYALKNKRDTAFYWAVSVVNKLRGFSKRRSEFFLFNILESLAKKKDKPFIEISKRWFTLLKVKENFLCYLFPVFLIVNNTREDAPKNTFYKYKDIYLENLYKKNMSIDSYVIDMHTKRGRMGGNTKKKFIEDGSLVTNESLFVDSTFKDAYITISLEKEGIFRTTEKENFKFIVRAQLNTSKNRPDTYFAKYFSETIFVKGPYETVEKAMIPISIFYIKKYLGLDYISLCIKMLIPNMFENVPLGIRNFLDLSIPHPFIFCKSLHMEEPLPTKIHSSKVWPDTFVLDQEKLQYKCAKNINEQDVDKYCLLVLFRYLLGIPDFADRNFIISTNEKVYSIDEENWDCNITLETSLNKNKFKLVTDEWKSGKYDETVRRWVNLMKIYKGDFPQGFIVRMERWLKSKDFI